MAIEVGAILEGKIINITNFGAFVEVDGKTGLVHISEIADTYVKDIRDFLQEGDTIQVKVLKVESDGKMSLSVKQANPEMKAREGTASQEESSGRERNFDDKPRTEKKAYNRPPQNDEWSGNPRPKPLEKGSQSFEDMMTRFQKDSEEKVAEFKRRSEAGGNIKRRKS